MCGVIFCVKHNNSFLSQKYIGIVVAMCYNLIIVNSKVISLNF